MSLVASSTPNEMEAPKGILNNAHEAPRKLSSGSESGFKAAFVPPAQPGRLMKNKDGKPLGKSFKRTDPLPDKFEGGEVLPYDPRGEQASVGDGVVPPGMPIRRESNISDSGYNSDHRSSLTDSDYTGKSWSDSSSPVEERGRVIYQTPSRARQASTASVTSTTSSSSSAAIRFCPLPVSGRLKRANSITIGVAARTHLLHSQGSAAPPRQYNPPQHLHGSQQWCQARANDDVVDVGEEIRKGALKAWKKIKGTSKEEPVSTPTAEAAPAKKQYPKEGAPVADPETGSIKVLGAAGVDKPGDQTPKRAPSPAQEQESPTQQLQDLSIEEEHGEEERAEAEMLDGPQHDSYHLADEHVEDGMLTPRSGMQRRLSTGTFLKGLSLRGIQEDRRRAVLGLQGEEAQEGVEVRLPSGKEEELSLDGYGHQKVH